MSVTDRQKAIYKGLLFLTVLGVFSELIFIRFSTFTEAFVIIGFTSFPLIIYNFYLEKKLGWLKNDWI